jgi:hypothetical protein
MREIEEVNELPPNSISATRWIKPPNRRSPRQLFGHAILSFTDPKSANKAIAGRLSICHAKIDVAKNKKEPIRCMKCQQWGHLALTCASPHDKCGTCGEHHRTSDCNSPGRFCVPCGVYGHPSWDRGCPTFGSKCEEMDQRTPGNQLPYFPTEEPWTQKPLDDDLGFFTNMRRRQGQRTDQRPGSTAPPLINRIGPLPNAPRSTRNPLRSRGLTQQGDPSLPDVHGYAPDDPMPQAENHRNEWGSSLPSRNGTRPDARRKAAGKAKATDPVQGPSRSIQTRLDDYRYVPSSQPRTLGPSRVNTLSKDINELIRLQQPCPNPNFFAPIAPADLGDDDAATASPDAPSPPPSPSSPYQPMAIPS